MIPVVDRVAYRLYGGLIDARMTKHPALALRLQQARHPSPGEAYLAGTYGLTGLALLFALLPIVGYVSFDGRDPGFIIPLVALAPMVAAIVYSWRLLSPDLVVANRRAEIDANLLHALNHLSALAGAGMLPARMFGSVGRQKVYGALAEEAAWIERDVDAFNRDLLVVLRDAAARSPSPQWAEFLLGSLNTITSGGALSQYIAAKTEQFEQEARRNQRMYLESMGIMAESYVVVAAAAPLFLLIIFSVMALLSSKISDPTLMLNALVFVAMPLIHALFSWILRNVTPT